MVMIVIRPQNHTNVNFFSIESTLVWFGAGSWVEQVGRRLLPTRWALLIPHLSMFRLLTEGAWL